MEELLTSFGTSMSIRIALSSFVQLHFGTGRKSAAFRSIGGKFSETSTLGPGSSSISGCEVLLPVAFVLGVIFNVGPDCDADEAGFFFRIDFGGDEGVLRRDEAFVLVSVTSRISGLDSGVTAFPCVELPARSDVGINTVRGSSLPFEAIFGVPICLDSWM